METKDRKLQQKIARRKEKVERLIREQENRLAALDCATFINEKDYYQEVSAVRKKLYRLNQELSSLEDGRLPGTWA